MKSSDSSPWRAPGGFWSGRASRSMKGLAILLLRRPPLRRRTRRKSVTPRLGLPSPVRRDPQRVVILGAHHPGLARWQKPHCHATTTTNAPFRGADRSRLPRQPWPPWDSPEMPPALVSGVDQVAGRARYRLRHLRSRGAPRLVLRSSNEDAEEAPRVRPVGGSQERPKASTIFLPQNVGDGLAGGVVHPDGVPVAMDVRHESRGRDSRQFASDKRTRLFAPPSVVAEGRPQGRSGSYSTQVPYWSRPTGVPLRPGFHHP